MNTENTEIDDLKRRLSDKHITSAALRDRIEELERENNRMRWLMLQLVTHLPKKRDWLNPAYEREMRVWANDQKSAVSELRWDDPKWWPVRCPVCGWEGMSNEADGGNEIADTGDYDDIVCPHCIAFGGVWIPVVEIPKPNTQGGSQSSVKNL